MPIHLFVLAVFVFALPFIDTNARKRNMRGWGRLLKTRRHWFAYYLTMTIVIVGVLSLSQGWVDGPAAAWTAGGIAAAFFSYGVFAIASMGQDGLRAMLDPSSSIKDKKD